MHIVFVSREYIPSHRAGGIASYIKEISHALVNAGNQVTVICASDDTCTESDYYDGNVRIIRLRGGDFYIHSVENSRWRVIRKFRMLYRFVSYRKRIQKTILKLNEVDIIEVPEFGAESMFLFSLPYPVIIRLHTPTLFDRFTQQKKKFQIRKFYDYIIGYFEFKAIKKSQYITSCSMVLAEWIKGNLLFPESPDIKVIYNPINIDKWVSLVLNQKKVIPNQIFFAGSVVPDKGVEELIIACILLRNKYQHDIKLYLAGKEGRFANEIRVKYSDCSDWCFFLGQVNQSVLSEYYASSDLVCFPSWWDNMPLVCLEAMAQKALVLGSSSGGMSEVIDDEVDGFLVQPKNSSILAERIHNILQLSDPSKNQIREKALLKVMTTFDTKRIVPQMMAYYRGVINQFYLKENESSLD